LPCLTDRGPPGPCRSVYLHVPYCTDRCTYCAFATVADRPAEHSQLIGALLRELERHDFPSGLATVYLGGGTPGLLHPDLLATLLEGVRARAPLDSDGEVTLEVNPANVEPSRLASWTALGITRLSIGVQTFDNDALREYGRHHDGPRAMAALGDIATHWGGTWSADLLVGHQSQNQASITEDIVNLMGFSPPHVAIYGLTLEPGTTLFARREKTGVDPFSSTQAHVLDQIWSNRLEQSGYTRYEASNFSRGAAHRSRHNQTYWKNDAYSGIGPGAASSRHPYRWSNVRETTAYLGCIQQGRSVRTRAEVLQPGQRLLESLGVGLRTLDGIPTSELDRRFSQAWRSPVQRSGIKLFEAGFLILDGERLAIPAQHMVRADSILSSLARSLGTSSLFERPASAPPCNSRSGRI
jgi:oxygen-independent coproporphyrinogen-3 oxidase